MNFVIDSISDLISTLICKFYHNEPQSGGKISNELLYTQCVFFNFFIYIHINFRC
jgi:hypothetical protein